MLMTPAGIRSLFGRFLKLRQEIGWILIGQLLGFVGGFIGIKVLTNLLGPAGYGQLALGLTIAGVFNLYLYGPLSNVVARFLVVYRERGQLPVYFAVLKKFHAVLAVAVSSVALLAGAVCWSLWGADWALIVILSCFHAVATGINLSYITLQSAIRQRKVVALHQGADAWLRTGLCAVLLLVFGKTVHYSLLGYLLGTLMVTASQAVFALKNVQIRDNWKSIGSDAQSQASARREFSRYALSFVAFSVFASISMYADRWLIQGLLGVGAVGIYAAIYQIAASPVNVFFAMVTQLAVPIVYERAGDLTTAAQERDSAALVNQCVMLSSLVMVLVAGVAFCFSEQLVRLLTSGSFVAESSILWVTVVGLTLFNVGQLYTLKGSYCNCPQRYFLPKGLQAVTFVISAYLLASRIGMLGVAIGLCVSSLTYLVAVIFVNSRITPAFRINCG